MYCVYNRDMNKMLIYALQKELGIAKASATVGNMFGVKYKSKAEQMGGIILILIALKILIEYLFSSYF